METVKELKQYFETIRHSDDKMFTFSNKLLQSDSKEYMDYHYSLFWEKNIDDKFHNWIIRKFNDRSTVGEEYLLNKIQTEKSNIKKATILQVLGSFIHNKGKKQKEILKLAKDFLKSGDAILRSRAIMIIGWLGGSKDIDLISISLFNDSSGENRSLAATSLSQIFFNQKEIAPKALVFLKKALITEKDIIALQGILVAIQQITGKKLGLTSTRRGKTDDEAKKINKALKNAAKLLENIKPTLNK